MRRQVAKGASVSVRTDAARGRTRARAGRVAPDLPQVAPSRGYGARVIDFQNATYVKLGRIDYSEVAAQIDPLLMKGEQSFLAFKGMRDYIVFTSKRIISR